MLKKELLTVDEVADILRTTPNTIYRWLRSGKMAGVKIGKEWRIDQKTLEMMLKSHRDVAPPDESYLDKIHPQHDHVLVVTSNSHELYDLETDYFLKGMAKGHRLFKGCWWQHPDDVRHELTARGLPVESLESSDALVIVDLDKQYRRKGITEPVKSWEEEAKKTVTLGHGTMWGSGSPHLLACNGNVSGLIDFESLLDKVLKNLPVVGICPYVFENCITDYYEPFIDLVNHHRSLIFYNANKAAYLKN